MRINLDIEANVFGWQMAGMQEQVRQMESVNEDMLEDNKR